MGARSSCTAGAVLPAAPHEEAHARAAGPTWLIPHTSSCTAHPARLVLHDSSHTAHPTRLAPHRVQWVGSGAGRESGKQETGSAEHRSRATSDGARAKNSSGAAPGAGQERSHSQQSPSATAPMSSRGSRWAAMKPELPSGKRNPEGPQTGRRAEQTP